MFCCAVLILVLGLCRVAWLFLRGSVRGSEPGFAPPARRPRPGPVGRGATAGAGRGFADVGQPVGRPAGGPDDGVAVIGMMGRRDGHRREMRGLGRSCPRAAPVTADRIGPGATAGPSELVPIPPIPEFGRVHGPGSRFLLRRSLAVLALCWVAGLALSAFGSWVGVRAFGLGLCVPGGGFLYTGHLVVAVVALLAVMVSLGLWWLCGIAILPPAVWLAAAALPAVSAGNNPVVRAWALWAVPCLLAAAIAASVLYQQLRFRVHRRRGQAYNRRLAQQQPLRPVAAGTPSPREAGVADLKILRYVLDLALQPHESWQGFFFVRPEQFREGAVRYQLNSLSYTAAMSQYSCAPAFTGYPAEAQRNVIAKMLEPGLELLGVGERLGQPALDRDPITNDNSC